MQWIFWLIAVIVSIGAGYLVYRADKRRAVPYPWLTSLLRSIVVFLSLLLLLMPTITVSNHVVEQPIALLLQDNSRSAGIALGADTTTYRKNVTALAEKLGGKYKVVEWGFGSRVQTDSFYQYWQGATDISMALARAQEFFGMQNLGAIVLATDGRFNQGLNPMYQQLGLHSSLYTVALGDSARQRDLRIARTYANKVVALNSSFEVRADIVGELCKGYNNSVVIKEEGETLQSTPIVINADKFDRSVSFTLKASKKGLHHYTIQAPEWDGEQNVANNRKELFVEVADEQKNILIAAAAPHPDVNAIKEALSQIESYKVTVCQADNMPESLTGYDVVVLHGLPAPGANVAAKVLAAKKPLWVIVSAQTDITAFNSLQPLTHATTQPAMPHDVVGLFNTSFNTFSLPQQIQTITDKMPPLLTVSGAVNAGPGSNALFRQRVGVGGEPNPVWTLQQGAVPTALLMGEGLWRWRLHEYKNFNDHTVIDECIRQTIAFLAANNNDKPFSVVMPKYLWSDQEPVSLNAYLLNANNEQVNTADVQLTITDSAGRKQDFSFERSGTGYKLNIGIWAGGVYTYSAKAAYNDKTLTANGSFVIESVPLELMESGADYALLYGLAKKYNGGFVTAANVGSLYDSIIKNDRIKPLIITNTESAPLVDRKWFFFVLLAFAVVEWLLRKYWLAQ